jgi:precorrin-6A synthase
VRTVLVIGAGMGEADHLTGAARRAMGRVDTFLTLDKGAPGDLGAVRRALCDAVLGSGTARFADAPDPPRDRTAPAYAAAVDDWTAARAAAYRDLLVAEVPEGGTAGLLAWGDPAFYDSTLRILDGVDLDLHVEVVPGISSIQILAAAHRLSLTRVGRPVLVTTGRRLAEGGMPAGVDDVVVMLDGQAAYRCIDPDGLSIHWGAHLGGAHQVLVAGDLRDVAGEVTRARAAARAARGWVMDTYLLRRG